jgi:hypothetical protein
MWPVPQPCVVAAQSPDPSGSGRGLRRTSVTAAVLALGFGLRGAAYVVLALLIVAAALEAALGFCLGCKMFALLMRAGVIPKEVCDRCNSIWAGRD